MPITVDTVTVVEMMKHHPSHLVRNVARELLGLRKFVAKPAPAPSVKPPKNIVKYVVLRTFEPADVLPLASYKRGDLPDYQEFEAVGETVRVRMTSKRYILFGQNPCCVRCGIKGTIMSMEYQRSRARNVRHIHFNLYAVKDGRLILMTKDHILPKSKGGLDHMANLQTMCEPCNSAKGGSLEQEIAA